MILINLGRQCEWRLEPAMLTYRRARAKLNLLAVSITRHISMVANPNVPISVGKLCNLTPSGGRLSGGVFGQGYVMVLRIISGERFDLGWSWPPLGKTTT